MTPLLYAKRGKQSTHDCVQIAELVSLLVIQDPAQYLPVVADVPRHFLLLMICGIVSL